MQSVAHQPAYRYRPSIRTRAGALALSLATCLLILIALIKMGALLPGDPRDASRLIAIDLSPTVPASSPTRTRNIPKTRQATRSNPPIRREVRVLPEPNKPVPPLNFLRLSREEFAAADISKMPRRADNDSEANRDETRNGKAGSHQAGASTYGPGEGPGGAKLYNAEWYREPTRAELATYMPQRSSGGGWAMIACRTEERYRVTDCRELGESQPGAGLARAMRLAAWQFMVRPPRVDGKPVIGAWVRIRFDFTAAPRAQPTAEAPG